MHSPSPIPIRNPQPPPIDPPIDPHPTSTPIEFSTDDYDFKSDHTDLFCPPCSDDSVSLDTASSEPSANSNPANWKEYLQAMKDGQMPSKNNLVNDTVSKTEIANLKSHSTTTFLTYQFVSFASTPVNCCFALCREWTA
jgi:hypothetical protein